jgi:NAD(P)-dependent dehydrogenase (short-subunit alcohol dehydrogenase family)
MKTYPDLFNLRGKTALITGGASGIGNAITKGLAKFGCDVAIVDLNSKSRKRITREIELIGRGCTFYEADVTNFESINEAVKNTIADLGKIDILINSAGCNIRKPALEYSEEQWDRIIDTNLKGVFFATQAVGKTMTRRGMGKIINIASVMGLVGSPPYQTVVPYCASKGGVVQLTKSFALEWAKYNVHVNAIAPGPVKTPLTKAFIENKKVYHAILLMIPLKRFAKPEDLIGSAVFLASKASDYVTGHILYVDGGWLAQ